MPNNNAAERALRGIALGRKSWLFAGSDRGGKRAAVMDTLIGTAKLNDVDPQAWLADVLARIADLPQTRLPELLPWLWKAYCQQALAAKPAVFAQGLAEGSPTARSRRMGHGLLRTLTSRFECRRRSWRAHLSVVLFSAGRLIVIRTDSGHGGMPFAGDQALEIASKIGQSDLSLGAPEAAGVDHGMDPCRQSTSGTTHARIRPPPLSSQRAGERGR